MNIARITVTALLLLTTQLLVSQETDYSKVNLHPPLDIPLYLSGTFGELRSNHFHSGIDIKTGGREGLPIYASGDGYVSRINVSLFGYGKAIYITHPNGFVTVYGHLQKFNGRIEEYVKDLQYEKESFTLQCYPTEDELPVKKGDIIAWSGNTGGSSAPHLHYEVRQARSQYPVNPLFFGGLKVNDKYRPKIIELAIYPVDKHSLINGENDTVFYPVAGAGLHCHLAGNPVIPVSGRVSFGIRVYDPMNDVANQNGVYLVEMLIDTQQVFKLEMDELSFATTRYLNSLIDYHYFQKMKRRMIRTQIDTNNRLFNYRDVLSNGIYSFNDNRKHQITFGVEDVHGNRSVFKFALQPVLTALLNPDRDSTNQTNSGLRFNFSKQNHLSQGSISLSFPANTFYRSFNFHLDSAAMNDRTYSPLYKIHDRFTPIHKSYTIAIKPARYPDDIKNKLFIALVDDKSMWYIGGDWKGDRLMAETRLFGNYTVMADTTAPEIEPLNIWNNKNMQDATGIRVKIIDKETGIESYKATVNGKWILMEFETKTGVLTYEMDGHLQAGENNFRLEVEDKRGNITVYETVLIR